MKLHTDDIAPLRAAAIQAAAAVSAKTTIPVLQNLRLRVANGFVSVTGTDIDQSIETHLPAAEFTVTEDGCTTVPAKLFVDTLKRLPQDEATQLDLDAQGRLRIRAGHLKSTLATLPANDFPEMSPINGASLKIHGSVLADLLANALGSVSAEEARFYLRGVYVECFEGKLRLVSTNGHQLTLVDTQATFEGEWKPIIIPSEAVVDIARMVAASKTDVELVSDGNMLSLLVEGAALATRLIDGTFPDYARVIPTTENKKNITIPVAAMLAAAQRVQLVAEAKTRPIKLMFEQGKCLLSSKGPDGNEASDQVEVRFFGDPIDIGFNASYLVSILTRAEKLGDNAEFYLGDSNSPLLARPTNQPEACSWVLMPMRI